MGGDDVVPLGERLHHHLPVRRDLLHRVEGDVATLDVERLEVLDELRRIGLERLARRVEVHHHEPLPHGHAHLWQPVRFGVAHHLREVPGAGDIGEVTVDRPGPPVERAPERAHPAALGAQRGAAVQARVVEGADDAVGAASDQQRLAGDVVDDVAARFGELLLTAGQLPGAPPHVVAFELGEQWRRVARLRHRSVPLRRRRSVAEGHRYGSAVGGQQVGHGRSRTARCGTRCGARRLRRGHATAT